MQPFKEKDLMTVNLPIFTAINFVVINFHVSLSSLTNYTGHTQVSLQFIFCEISVLRIS